MRYIREINVWSSRQTTHPPTHRFQKSDFWRLASGSASSSFNSSFFLPWYSGHFIVHRLHTLVLFIVTRSGILMMALAKLFSLRSSSHVPGNAAAYHI